MVLKRRGSPESDKSASSTESHQSWEQLNAIVYDVGEQTLEAHPRSTVPADCRSEKLPQRPRRTLSNLLSSKDSIHISVASGENQPFGFLANLKMDSLGPEVSRERRKGSLNEIFLKGVPAGSRVSLTSGGSL